MDYNPQSHCEKSMILKQSNTPNHHSESHANPNSHSEIGRAHV